MPCFCVSIILRCGIQSGSNLVDFGPAVFDAGDIIKGRTVFPEWTFLDIKNKGYGGEVHISVSVHLGRFAFGRPAGRWRASE